MGEVDNFMKIFQITLRKEKVVQAFCISRAPVLDDTMKRHEYFSLQFTDWLEFLTRVLHKMMFAMIDSGEHKPTYIAEELDEFEENAS